MYEIVLNLTITYSTIVLGKQVYMFNLLTVIIDLFFIGRNVPEISHNKCMHEEQYFECLLTESNTEL
jgi:hypothetical protein